MKLWVKGIRKLKPTVTVMDKLFNAFDTKFTVCGKFVQKKNKTSPFQGYHYCFNCDIVRNRIGKKEDIAQRFARN